MASLPQSPDHHPRLLVVGDIHGCLTELHALLAAAALADADWLLSVGDFSDRGPDSVGVYDFLRQRPRTICLLGNHEDKLVRGRREGLAQALSQQITRLKLGPRLDEFLDWCEGLPLYHRLPEYEAIVVHAGYLGNLAERRMLLRGLRPQDHTFSSRFRWWQHYYGPQRVICGHREIARAQVGERVTNLDTGCVHGGRLSGLLLPEWKIISVPAACDYWTRERAAFAAYASRAPPVAKPPRPVPRDGRSAAVAVAPIPEADPATPAAELTALARQLDDVGALLGEAETVVIREARTLRAAVIAEFAQDLSTLPHQRMPEVVAFLRSRTRIPVGLVMAHWRHPEQSLRRRLAGLPPAVLLQVTGGAPPGSH